MSPLGAHACPGRAPIRWLGDAASGLQARAGSVPELVDVVALHAGSSHGLALREDGTMWTWGNNDYLQLGDGTSRSRGTPARVEGLEAVIAVAPGAYFSLSLLADGTVRAWGATSFGQLGQDGPYPRGTPQGVAGLTDVTALAAGVHHALALKRDGTVWAWGSNAQGQLGDGHHDVARHPGAGAGAHGRHRPVRGRLPHAGAPGGRLGVGLGRQRPGAAR